MSKAILLNRFESSKTQKQEASWGGLEGWSSIIWKTCKYGVRQFFLRSKNYIIYPYWTMGWQATLLCPCVLGPFRAVQSLLPLPFRQGTDRSDGDGSREEALRFDLAWRRFPTSTQPLLILLPLGGCLWFLWISHVLVDCWSIDLMFMAGNNLRRSCLTSLRMCDSISQSYQFSAIIFSTLAFWRLGFDFLRFEVINASSSTQSSADRFLSWSRRRSSRYLCVHAALFRCNSLFLFSVLLLT